MKVVRIEWEDSSSTNRVWNSKEFLANQTNQRISSIGYLIHEDSSCVIVSSHRGLVDDHGREDYAGEMRIPKGCIKKRKVLFREK